MKYLAVVLLPVMFLTSCLGKPAELPSQTRLMSFAASELPQSVYEVIAKDQAPNNDQKNAILAGVKSALHTARTPTTRQQAITKTLNDNGGPYPILAAKIFEQVDIERPVTEPTPKTPITTPTASGLDESIYNIIAAAILPSENKNKMMLDVHAATATPGKFKRDIAVTKAVTENGGTVTLKKAVMKQVNIVTPMLILPGEIPTLDFYIYKIIRDSHELKNKINLQNSLFMSIMDAMELSTKTERDAAIEKAVGNQPSFSQKIVNKADSVKPLLLTASESGLEQNIHEAITSYLHKDDKIKVNKILLSAKAPIEEYKKGTADALKPMFAEILTQFPDAGDEDKRDELIAAIIQALTDE